MKVAGIWKSFGITKAFLDEKACWLAEERVLDYSTLFFFREAGKLVEFSWYHYPFASLALFQGVIGVERTLRLFYKSTEKSFRELFQNLAADSVVSDAVFSDFRPKTCVSSAVKGPPGPYVGVLANLIPKLRNDFVHGEYQMSPEFLHLCLQMRQLADAVFAEVQRRERVARDVVLKGRKDSSYVKAS